MEAAPTAWTTVRRRQASRAATAAPRAHHDLLTGCRYFFFGLDPSDDVENADEEARNDEETLQANEKELVEHSSPEMHAVHQPDEVLTGLTDDVGRFGDVEAGLMSEDLEGVVTSDGDKDVMPGAEGWGATDLGAEDTGAKVTGVSALRGRVRANHRLAVVQWHVVVGALDPTPLQAWMRGHIARRSVGHFRHIAGNVNEAGIVEGVASRGDYRRLCPAVHALFLGRATLRALERQEALSDLLGGS